MLIFMKESRELVGGIGLTAVRRGVAQMASLGYWAGKAFSRQGLMTEAVRAMVGYGFRHAGLHRIEAACLPHNEASRRLLLRVGFEQEGYAKAYLRIDGAWRDHLLFGLSREDFEAMHPA
jgi:ribosomal-protein-alanine N-acetyltransferase